MLRVLIACCIVALAGAAHADVMPTSRAMMADTIAEIFVDDGAILVELEIGVSSLPAFAKILPDEIRERLDLPAIPLADRAATFFAEDWVVRADGGAPLVPRVEGIEGRPRRQRDQVTGESIAAAEDETVLFVVMRYGLEDRPASLTFQPPLGAGGRGANIGFVVYHRGVVVNDFRYLGRSETLRLDWDDPWYTAFTNRNLRRYFSAPLNAFLYVEPLEVRKEVVVRPRDMEAWIDLGLDDSGVILAAQRPEIERRVAAFLLERCPVLVDGRAVAPVLDRVHFIRRTLRTTMIVEPDEDVHTDSALLGVIFVYPITSLPREVTMEWELFSDRIREVSTIATDEAGGLPWTVTPEDPVLRWENFLKNPTLPASLVEVPPPARPELRVPIVSMIGLVLAATFALRPGRRPASRLVQVGAPAALVASAVLLWPFARLTVPLPLGVRTDVTTEQAGAVVGGLLHNIYRSFDLREEEAVYDTLALSAAGDLLTRIYVETQQALTLQNQGGARVKVKGVDMLDVEPAPLAGEQGFEARCRWNVTGTVGHWGHNHQRTNQYDARLTVRVVDGVWRITGLEVLEEKRLS